MANCWGRLTRKRSERLAVEWPWSKSCLETGKLICIVNMKLPTNSGNKVFDIDWPHPERGAVLVEDGEVGADSAVLYVNSMFRGSYWHLIFLLLNLLISGVFWGQDLLAIMSQYCSTDSQLSSGLAINPLNMNLTYMLLIKLSNVFGCEKWTFNHLVFNENQCRTMVSFLLNCKRD